MKASFRFNCIDGFDLYGDCLSPEFKDASEFSRREEFFRQDLGKGNVGFLSRRNFENLCEVPFPVNDDSWEFYSYPPTQYASLIYVAYDIENDIHYFFS
ncbi:MAG: hypothetical protein M0R32_02555 [Candidatus Cloacimonetes bacterium]|jgi:hypothetical protein|nr:hypothetical protein [Candidatus Cloacimonadota bacterium]